MKKRMLKSILVVIGIAFLSTVLYFFFAPVIPQANGLVFYLKPGTSKKVIAQQLTDQGAIPFPTLMDVCVLLNYKAQLKTGEYAFKKGSTYFSIWRQITTGTGLYYRSFTIVPGWTFAQLKKNLNTSPALKPLAATMTDQTIMSYMGAPNTSPEGEFYPDTYFYTRDTQDLVILKRAYDLMQNRVNDAWSKRNTNIPYKTPYQALIAASLIEKEAYLDTERPIISGVIVNRLNKNMILQIDPTVIFGLGEKYSGKITKENLKQDTPYNTYTRKGLPPTPIAIPSQASLDAAMRPAAHDYLYFVAKGDGSHQFSTNLSDHNTAVKTAISKQVGKP
jgi:UPF0755 protein